MADWREEVSKYREKFEALPIQYKAAIIAAPIFLISIIAVAILLSTKTDYAVLYTGLNQEDLNAIITELDKEGVRYKIDNAGRTVLVPEGKERELRLKLAAKGIPNKGIVGYELFDKTSIGISDFQQQVNFKRAVEGELARTILKFKNIQDARVHIAIPEKSVFIREEEETKASVFIKLKPGHKITKEQVKAIRSLVAASVENLKPENVVVIDGNGRDLTAMLEEEEGEITSKQLKLKQQFEKNLERKIQSALEDVFGYGNVKVRISTELDFSKSEKREEIYDPDMTAVVSEQKKKEKTYKEDVAGVPGTPSNIPPAPGVRPGGTTNTISEKKESITNYEVSKKELRVIDPTMKIKRISVGVILNGKPEEVNVEQVKSIVSAAAGLDTKRGDTISVVAMPFKKPEVVEEKPPYPPYLKFVVPAVAGIVLLLLVFFGLKKLKKPPPEVVVEGAPVGEGAEEAFEITGAEVLREKAKELEIIKTITEIAREEPKKVAGVLKAWLRHEE